MLLIAPGNGPSIKGLDLGCDYDESDYHQLNDQRSKTDRSASHSQEASWNNAGSDPHGCFINGNRVQTPDASFQTMPSSKHLAGINLLRSLDRGRSVVVANRPFHFTYEAWPVKLLILGDTPSFLVMGLTVEPFMMAVENPPREVISYVDYFSWVMFGALQWWALGVYLSKRRSGEA
jgi:hypothetical protein